MKLTKGKLLETLRRKNDGWTTYQVRKIGGVSVRRVNQVFKQYQESGRIPELSRAGRPAKQIEDWEVCLVKLAYEKYKVRASTLEKCIAEDYDRHISHNRVHRIMLQLGLAKAKLRKDKRKKDWIRYERRHSLTAVHVDWHQRPNDGIWVFKVEDDASRAMLAIRECNSPTTEKSIDGMNEALTYGPIRECISDHGSQFTSNRNGKSTFKAFLDANNIKQILCRVKHPQSNGKIERLFYTYERQRDSFPNAQAYQHWYNEVRPHRSLRFDKLETPAQAFQRKLRK